MKEGMQQAINAVRSEARLLRDRDESHPLLEGMSHAETLLFDELSRLDGDTETVEATEAPEAATTEGGRNFQEAEEITDLKVDRLEVGELHIDQEGGDNP